MRIYGVVVSFLIAVASQAVPLRGSEDAGSHLPDGVVARLGNPVRSNHYQAVAIAFSRDDELLACAGLRTQPYRGRDARFPIEVYDTEKMNRLVILAGNEAPVEALQISRSKDWVASLGGGVVHLWSLPSGERFWSVRHVNAQQAAFSADGKHLFVADRSEQVWVVDLESGEVVEQRVLAKAEQPVDPWAGPAVGGNTPGEKRKVRIAFSEKDGTMIIEEEGKEPVKLDLRAMGRKLNYWRRIRFLPDGKNLVWLTDEGTFEVRDVMTGKIVTDPSIDVGVMIRKKFNGDDEEPSPVGLLWPSSNSQSVQVRVSDTVSQMSFDGKTVRKTLFSWPPPASWLEGEYSLSPDLEPDEPRGKGEGKMAWFADSLAISPDGKLAALMGRRDANRSEVRVLDLERETTVRTFALESRYRERRLYKGRIHATPQIRSLKPVTGSFSHDGKRLAVEMMGEIRLLELDTGEEVIGENGVAEGEEPIQQEHEDKIAAVVFSPDGELVATASYDSTIRLWNATTGEESLRREHEWLSAPQYAVAFSPDSTLLAADLGNKVEVLRCKDGETICMLEGKAVSSVSGAATAVGFSSDGSRLATWLDLRRSLTWWELPSGRQIKTIRMELLPEDKPTEGPTHTDDGSLQSFAFSPDMRRLAMTAYLDRVLIQFDAETGERLHRVTSGGRLGAACFSGDMKRFVVGGDGEPFRVFDMETGDQIRKIVPGGRQSGELSGYWMNPHYDQRLGIGAGSGAERPQLFLDEGRILVTVDLTGSRFYDVRSGRLIGELPDHGVRTVSPDGRRVATVMERNWTSPSGDLWPTASTILIWNTEELPVQLRPR